MAYMREPLNDIAAKDLIISVDFVGISNQILIASVNLARDSLPGRDLM